MVSSEQGLAFKFWEAINGNSINLHCFGDVLDSPDQQTQREIFFMTGNGVLFDSPCLLGGGTQYHPT